MVDDDLITPAGIMPNTSPSTPLLAGFHLNARIFRLIGNIHTARSDLRRTTTGEPADLWTASVRQFFLPGPKDFLAELDEFVADLPRRLRPVSGGGAAEPDLDAQKSDAALEFENGFATCRTNLLITTAMARYLVRQYARELGQNTIDTQMSDSQWIEEHILGLLKTSVHKAVL